MTEHAAQIAELRTLPDSMIVGECMDCGIIFKGYLGFQFFEHEGVPGLEVFVCADNEAHAIARVQVGLIPKVGANDANRTATSGSGPS